MIEVHIGASVFKCSTPEEAARIHQLVGGSAQPVVHHVAVAQPSSAPVARSAPLAKPVQKSRASAFLKKLETVAGQELDVPAMVKLMGVRHPNGIGPRFARFRKNLAAENIALDELIEKVKSEVGEPPHWIVRLEPLPGVSA